MWSTTADQNFEGLPQRRPRVRWWPIVLFALFALYYYTANQQTVPITGRSQLVDMSRDDEVALGLQSYRQILNQSNVVPAGAEVDLIREVGQRISRAAADIDPGFQWQFNLLNDSQPNAFALPGGYVAVYTGILPVVENANGLAVVMGHEISHAIARHGAERMAHQKLFQIGTVAASIALGEMDRQTQQQVLGALGVGAQFGVLLPFSRKHESEADYMGLILLARACYDPREAPHVWERMSQAAQGSPMEFMSTHPSHETRIAQFEHWMPEAINIYNERCPNKIR